MKLKIIYSHNNLHATSKEQISEFTELIRISLKTQLLFAIKHSSEIYLLKILTVE